MESGLFWVRHLRVVFIKQTYSAFTDAAAQSFIASSLTLETHFNYNQIYIRDGASALPIRRTAMCSQSSLLHGKSFKFTASSHLFKVLPYPAYPAGLHASRLFFYHFGILCVAKLWTTQLVLKSTDML